MKYDHTVKVNGIFYKAGEEVPELNAGASKKEESPELTPAEQVKRCINEVKRMNKEKLLEHAGIMEVDIPDGTNNETMKEMIIAKIKERAAANGISLD